ncbi:MAG TPA: hypothetical protein VIH92_10685 [Solirubrobacteraceae bacterium]|jgi:hypothetical protein
MRHVEDIRNFPSNVRRLRERRRKRLTRGERILGWSLALGPGVLVILAVAMLLFDDARTLGIALLIVALAGMAVPIAPLLGAKVRRREARAARKQRE